MLLIDLSILDLLDDEDILKLQIAECSIIESKAQIQDCPVIGT